MALPYGEYNGTEQTDDKYGVIIVSTGSLTDAPWQSFIHSPAR